ncbi:YopX family protein [Lacticaseibacillus rhamnosus]|uniref:YopX family protein n=1 Tax=Lacticaseibacillus rhamnosus TaxID=47715 RepID=UPI00237F0DBF|nr:YopX family protein [Lacticaseibacillus rhamnosus]MDE3301587.1 YopX family protein [Lacticaseibacillus rhamnosus]
MKREIKFRAWDKVYECYLYDVQGAYDMLSGCVKYENGENAVYDEECFAGFLDTDRYVVEQYTGLHDKNGREIYEGDILKVTSEDGESYAAIVKWFGDEGYPAFDLAGIPETWNYDANALATIFESGIETCEVIGNIFEDNQLLEGKR